MNGLNRKAKDEDTSSKQKNCNLRSVSERGIEMKTQTVVANANVCEKYKITFFVVFYSVPSTESHSLLNVVFCFCEIRKR